MALLVALSGTATGAEISLGAVFANFAQALPKQGRLFADADTTPRTKQAFTGLNARLISPN
jgi:hypothetical protein